jgi:hypothetical protein
MYHDREPLKFRTSKKIHSFFANVVSFENQRRLSGSIFFGERSRSYAQLPNEVGFRVARFFVASADQHSKISASQSPMCFPVAMVNALATHTEPSAKLITAHKAHHCDGHAPTQTRDYY